MTSISGAILAGGRSVRFGRDKSELIYKGQSFLQHSKDILFTTGLSHIHISHPDYIADQRPGLGPLSGIYSILSFAAAPDSHVVFIPVDMPHITGELISGLVEAPQEQDLITYRGHHMPLRLVNTQEMQKRLEAILSDGSNLSLGYFFDQIERHQILDCDHLNPRIFSNVNTPSDYKALS